jgi:hypothetical protein
MLHPIPESPLRDALLKLVEIQRTLVEKLCALPPGSRQTLKWLKTTVWPTLGDSDWIEKFWNNDKGARKKWINVIAKSSVAEKQEILQLMNEQHDYAGIYNDTPGRRMTKTDIAFWKATPVRKAVKELLLCFYSPWLGAQHGYSSAMLSTTVKVTRLEYLRHSMPPLCPYCDSSLQLSAQIDHFLPQSSFPFLSVHPDNFIPSCFDSNEASLHKGDTPPLNWDETNQAEKFFHPRLRPASGRYSLSFRDAGRRLTLSLVAIDVTEQDRVSNLDKMFQLTDVFWGRTLEDDVQRVVEEVADYIRGNGLSADEQSIRTYLRQQACTYRRYIGVRPLNIVYASIYEFVANDDQLVTNTLKRI